MRANPLTIVRRIEHQEAFLHWLTLHLREQSDDLEGYLARQTAEQRDLCLAWLRRGSVEILVPAGALEPERLLFLSDLEIIVELIR